MQQILHQMAGFLVEDLCAFRNTDDKILSGFAVLFLVHAVLSVLGFVFGLVPEIHQRPQAVVRHKYNIAAFAAVAAVRAAFRHIRLSSECHGAIAASP